MMDEREKGKDRTETDSLKGTEFLYKTLAKNFPNGAIAIFDEDLRYRLIDGAGLAEVGLSSEQMTGRTIWEVFPQETCDVIEPYYRTVLAGESVEAEVPFRNNIFKVHHIPIFGDDGSVIFGMVMTQNVTEKKRQEAALRESEYRYREIFEKTSDCMFVLEVFPENRFRILDFNPAEEKATGMKIADVAGKYIDELVPPDVAVKLAENYRRCVDEEVPIGYDEVLEFDSILRSFHTVLIPLRDENGAITKIVGVARDLTEIKHQEELVQKSERHLRRIIDGLGPYMFVGLIRPDGTVVEANHAALTLAGLKLEDVVGKKFEETYYWSYSVDVQRKLREAINTAASGKSVRYDIQSRISDRQFISLDFSIQPILDERGKVEYLIPSGVVITERKLVEDALRESQRMYSELMENINDVIFSLDTRGRITFISPAVRSVIGYLPEELIGKTFEEFVFEEDRESASRSYKRALAGSRQLSEYRMNTKDGRQIWVQTSGRPLAREGKTVGVAGIATDITQRRHLEQQLFQSQKLESLGTLAGGLAHDFNNLLGIILGNLSILEKNFGDAGRIARSVETIGRAVDRGAALVRQLLTFARKSDPSFHAIRIETIVQEILPLMRETFPKWISVETKIDPNLPAVIADRTQIQQVLLNLCLNSRDAMPEGGDLVIRIGAVSGDLVRTMFPKAEAEEYVRIQVSDTGYGMDEETQNRIFEPFFTTKQSGAGSGLGLAMVYGIVERHGGHISVESAPESGATFQIFLPAGFREVQEETGELGIPEDPIGGNETVLIIEDEEMLRETIKILLEEKGYTVLAAKDGKSALEIYSENAKEISLVLSDVGLPELSGDRIFFELRKINPRLQVILFSGFLEPDRKVELLKAGVYDVLQKPYKANEILAKIRGALDRTEP
ncbi:PAS domain-containing sensor histidine kinase [Leptospira fluminis]|uniref:histidine kinase n=1 Tax=Leptospira fluminis TaxID=2484979 RepID=A0A4R9GQY3_9LEPT|nr:PAS domain-containing sensor histidine kinase [Leptospira fluminis]TGK20110.1 PAS domain-containing sensor histidine kinase [Leptospira fluminis]